ncbi:MAG: GGDEF domain-containing protein, partial [Atribacterota bacterium]|nr:GGDEF domain-containing protein [Atribacterota bacterium]
SGDTQKVEILDRAEKIRLYSFLSLVYTLDGVTYVLYTHFVLWYPLEKLFPWGALFVLFGMAVHYLGSFEMKENIRDVLYVALISLIALVFAPRVHFLGEILYASFFFTAMIVAVLLGSLWVFVLQGVLMGAILLFLWRPMAPLPLENGFTGFHALLTSFALFFALTFYVHRVYLRRLRENQNQLERQKAVGEISAQLVEVSHSNFEREFTRVLQTVDRYHGSQCHSFFLFSPIGKDLTGAKKWCYGNGCPDDTMDFPEELFLWLGKSVHQGEGFSMNRTGALLEKEFLSRMNMEMAFLQPVKRGEDLLGFLGCGTVTKKVQDKPFQEFAKVLSHRLADVLFRVAQEKDLYRTAFYDALTGLPNRTLFREHLDKAIQLARRAGKIVAVLFVDLDAFKTVNDAEGHEMGDRLLRRVAQRLLGCVREHDTVARFGGDEFLVLLAQLHQSEEVLPIVERILASFHQPFVVRNQEFFISASIGIALYPED